MCSGPYQAATSSGSVQALNTRSRGASKIRVIRTPSPAATSIESLTLLSFPAQMRVQSVHPGFPGPLARLHPFHRLFERLSLHPAGPPLGLAPADDKPRALEDLQVTRDGRQAHRERLRQLAHRRLALGETGHDRAARRVGERGEREAEMIGLHLTYQLINESIKHKGREACNPQLVAGGRVSGSRPWHAPPTDCRALALDRMR